jgi:predicted amidohydrolase
MKARRTAAPIFDAGGRVIDQGLLQHCISIDLTVPGRLQTVHSMTEMITRFLGLGFTLPQVVTMCTANPARAIGAGDRLRSLAVGRQADISVPESRAGDWMVRDVLGASLRVDRAVVPFVTVKRGQVFAPDRGRGPRAGSRTAPCCGGPAGAQAATGPHRASARRASPVSRVRIHSRRKPAPRPR